VIFAPKHEAYYLVSIPPTLYACMPIFRRRIMKICGVRPKIMWDIFALFTFSYQLAVCLSMIFKCKLGHGCLYLVSDLLSFRDLDGWKFGSYVGINSLNFLVINFHNNHFGATFHINHLLHICLIFSCYTRMVLPKQQ